MTFAIVGTLVGAAFGLGFQLIALVPVIGLSVAIVVAAGILNEDGWWSIASSSALIASLFQVGYLLGSVARLGFNSARWGRLRTVLNRLDRSP